MFVLPWIKENDSVEKVGQRIKLMKKKEQIRMLGGGDYGFLRRVILMKRTGDIELYKKYTEEANQFFTSQLNTDPDAQNYINLIEDLSVIRDFEI